MSEQKILIASEDYAELDDYFRENDLHKILLVCDQSIRFLRLNDYFNTLEERCAVQVVRFSDFQPNPLYESVVKGVQLFNDEHCQSIVAVGGGSGMDVAKCIKLYSNMDPGINYLKQPIVENNIRILAIPTTAGTGSEATRYAVIYFNGEKQSVNSLSCIPDTVLFDATCLKTLPMYQKKATMMDALSHAMESFWSINSTDLSKQYSRQAMKMILENMDSYLANDEKANGIMLQAANIAGKAINITQTTAGHAMSYKLTSLYHIAHGHAAVIVNASLLPWMLNNTDRCIDARGQEYVEDMFSQLALCLGLESREELGGFLSGIVNRLELLKPVAESDDFPVLDSSVNPVRLKNNPIRLDHDSIDFLYHEILETENLK